MTEFSIPPTVKHLNIDNNSPHHIERVLNKSLLALEKLSLSGTVSHWLAYCYHSNDALE